MNKYTIEYDTGGRVWKGMDLEGEWMCDAKDKETAKLIADALNFAAESVSFQQDKYRKKIHGELK